LAALLFGSGVLVGARFVRPQVLPNVQAEARPGPLPAAGPVSTQNSTQLAVPPLKVSHSRARHLLVPGASSAAPLGHAPEQGSPYAAALPAVAEWQRLVEVGDFAAARRALDRQGGFDVAIAHAAPAELMSLVDIARASGERSQAVSALRQVLSHPDAPEAPLAAWTLGNLLDQAGDQPGAAQAFALYRRLSPAGDFAEDAAARQVDVALAEGNGELVTQLVEDYARDFPHARRLSEFRRAAEQLAARLHDAGAKQEAVHDDSEEEADDGQKPASAPAPAPSSGTEDGH
jgi:tetratricopeptide (TPR) repeat protein